MSIIMTKVEVPLSYARLTAGENEWKKKKPLEEDTV